MSALTLLILGCLTFGSYGFPNTQNRIIGGETTGIEMAPYQASVQYLSQHMCGGTIVSAQSIVTAAHCVQNMQSQFMSVRVGSNTHSSDGKVIKVSKIETNPNYDSKSYDNDVAVLILLEEIEFNAQIYSIPMAELGDKYKEGENAMISGWGSTDENGPFSPVLLTALAPIISRETCGKLYGGGRVTEQMLCAGIHDPNSEIVNACKGDYGGPLMYNNKLIGIISWGIGCTKPGLPAVYTDVGTVREFINSVVV